MSRPLDLGRRGRLPRPVGCSGRVWAAAIRGDRNANLAAPRAVRWQGRQQLGALCGLSSFALLALLAPALGCAAAAALAPGAAFGGASPLRSVAGHGCGVLADDLGNRRAPALRRLLFVRCPGSRSGPFLKGQRGEAEGVKGRRHNWPAAVAAAAALVAAELLAAELRVRRNFRDVLLPPSVVAGGAAGLARGRRSQRGVRNEIEGGEVELEHFQGGFLRRPR
mmetsp:Transcript_6302/g.17589  ORF Transcript_6302/g.17589 Transcript_6302/m.17589 type:complete len:223 (-) Transcript_6302:311-979(-)